MRLKKIGILVTRPIPEGERFSEKIRDLGDIPYYFPTLDIQPSEHPSEIKQHIATLDTFDWLIFVSPQAVRFALPLIKNGWHVFPSHVRIAAVGGSTAVLLEQAKEAKLPQVLFPSENWSTEGLLALPEFQAIAGKKIAVFCGEGARNVLTKTLKKRNAKVEIIAIYRRLLPKSDPTVVIDALKKRQIHVILGTSTENVKNLIILLGKEMGSLLYTIPLIVVSQRVADYAVTLGFKKIILAKNSSDDSIIEAIEGLKRGEYAGSE